MRNWEKKFLFVNSDIHLVSAFFKGWAGVTCGKIEKILFTGLRLKFYKVILEMAKYIHNVKNLPRMILVDLQIYNNICQLALFLKDKIT